LVFLENGIVHYKGGIITALTRFANGNKVTVRARLTGEFPGSPVELDHIFRFSKNKIAALEIRSCR